MQVLQESHKWRHPHGFLAAILSTEYLMGSWQKAQGQKRNSNMDPVLHLTRVTNATCMSQDFRFCPWKINNKKRKYKKTHIWKERQCIKKSGDIRGRIAITSHSGNPQAPKASTALYGERPQKASGLLTTEAWLVCLKVRVLAEVL